MNVSESNKNDFAISRKKTGSSGRFFGTVSNSNRITTLRIANVRKKPGTYMLLCTTNILKSFFEAYESYEILSRSCREDAFNTPISLLPPVNGLTSTSFDKLG